VTTENPLLKAPWVLAGLYRRQWRALNDDFDSCESRLMDQADVDLAYDWKGFQVQLATLDEDDL